MANKQEHVRAGRVAGVVTAGGLALMQGESILNTLLEAAGGYAGGTLGGVLPDLIEPATSSWHRGIAHSVVVGGGTSLGAVVWAVPTLQAQCRERAVQHDRLRAGATGFNYLWHLLAASFWRLVAGFSAGVPAGYASHLLLDSRTPRGIPLVR